MHAPAPAGGASALQVEFDGRRTVIADSPASLGRDPGATVVVDHPLVSRVHGRLARTTDGWVYEDHDSSNGSFLDGVRVMSVAIDRERTIHLGDPASGAHVRLSVLAAPVHAPPGPTSFASSAPADGSVGHSVVRLGRDPSNDMVLADLLVSRHHAEIRPTPTGRQIVDLGSHNGTLVNGARVGAADINPGDLITIGRYRLRVGAVGQLEEHPDAEAALVARNVTVRTKSGTVLTDDVSLVLPPSSMVAILGPSGSGKSTLVGALSGQQPATNGRVHYGSSDVAHDAASLWHRIGSVPQDDLVHAELTVEQSLQYAARLRFPPDVPDDELSRRVDQVIGELGLGHRRTLRVRELSGGQRKRVSVALELLTRPSLLFLDEPTSGLDPGLERSMMEQLRQLANGGRIVVVITHSVESLHLCDLVVCLAPGGRLAYVGPPAGVCPFFGVDDFQRAFVELERTDADWPSRFAATRPPDPVTASVGEPLRPSAPTRQRWVRQYRTLVARYARVLRNDSRTLALLLVGAPVVGLMLLLRLPERALRIPPTGELRLFSQASIVLFLIMLGLTQLGVSMSIREIVKELPIYRRERSAGLSVSAYVASKATILGGLGTVQATIVVLIATARQGGPREAIVLGSARLELIAAAALASLAAVSLSLLCSALVSSADRVALLLPAVIGFQALAASGPIFPSGDEVPGLEQAAYASTAYWGFSASAATAELNDLQAFGELGRALANSDADDLLEGTVELPERTGSARFNHTARAWGTSMGVLGAMTAVFLAGAGVALRRHDRR